MARHAVRGVGEILAPARSTLPDRSAPASSPPARQHDPPPSPPAPPPPRRTPTPMQAAHRRDVISEDFGISGIKAPLRSRQRRSGRPYLAKYSTGSRASGGWGRPRALRANKLKPAPQAGPQTPGRGWPLIGLGSVKFLCAPRGLWHRRRESAQRSAITPTAPSFSKWPTPSRGPGPHGPRPAGGPFLHFA